MSYLSSAQKLRAAINGAGAMLTDEQALLPAVEALVRSLCSLESVEEVQFLVDGEFAKHYGPIPVEGPYTPDL